MNDPRLTSNIDFAIEIWVRFSATGGATQVVATNYDSANPLGFWALMRVNNTIEFIAGTNTNNTAPAFSDRISIVSPPINFNTFYHIVANRITNNPVNWELYINGHRIPGTVTVNGNPNYDYPLNLWQRTFFGTITGFVAPSYFSGDIAQARFYTRPLSQAEVKYNLRDGFYKPFAIDDIYFWAPFNNCQGAIADVFTTWVQPGLPRLDLSNFGSRTAPGGGAWVSDCGGGTIQGCSDEPCYSHVEDELLVKSCDHLVFPPYVRNSPRMNFPNLNTYNLYQGCQRVGLVELVHDWRARAEGNWANISHNLQAFKLYLDLENLPSILNLTVVKYDCNERGTQLDFAETFAAPTEQAILNKLIEWIENDVFPNSQVSVSGVPGRPKERILTVNVRPETDICDSQIIALSNPGALRPGQGGGGGSGNRTLCFKGLWNERQGAMESCASSAPPPDSPPAPACNAEENLLTPFTSIAENDLGLNTLGGCVTIDTPGDYTLEYTVNALIEQLFGWQGTGLITGNVHIIVEMIVLDQVYPIYNYNYTKSAAPTAPNCNGTLFWNPLTNSQSPTNPNAVVSSTLPPTTITVTPTHISNNQNKICLRTYVKTSAQLTCFNCDPNNCNRPSEIVCREVNLATQTAANCNTISLPPFYPPETCEDRRTGNLLFSNPGTDPGGIFYNASTGCFEMQTPGVYTIQLSNLLAALNFTHRTANGKLAASNHEGCLQLKIANLAPIVLTPPCPIAYFGLGNTNNCNEDITVTNSFPPLTQTITVNVTPAMISANQNKICFEYDLKAEVTSSGLPCETNAPATTLAITEVTLSGSMKICRGVLEERYVEAIGDVRVNGELKLCKTEAAGGGGGSGWYGSGDYRNERDKFLEDCFKIKSCFTGFVFWTNLCMSLWQDVICVSDNGTALELPCLDAPAFLLPSLECSPNFQFFRIGFSYQDTFTNRHVAFCSQKIRIRYDCDNILIRFRNDNEIYKTVRIEGTIEKIGFNKTQEVSYSSRGINRKLYSAVSQEWTLTTGYYSEKFHKHLMRALESDYFEAEINGEWHRFVFEDNYNIEWNEDIPNQKRGKAVVKLKSYRRDIYNDFCVFER
jgi:hypothetical protein